MPKGPITYREKLFSPIPGSRDLTDRGGAGHQLKELEWNAVQTELGTMIEPNSPPWNGIQAGTVQIDMTDNAINKITILDGEGMVASLYGTGGAQITDYGV